jgi:pilus assembly protein CpaE
VRNWKVLVLDVTEDLGRQVERVTSGLVPRPEVVSCEAVEAAEAMIADRGPFDVLIGGSMVSDQSGLQQLRHLRELAPQMKLILAFDNLRSSRMRDIVRTGALDVLRLPVSDEALFEAVEQALNAGLVPLEVAERPQPSADRGRVTTVVSATGGCGKTFLATNLGYFFQNQLGQAAKDPGRPPGRTCLLDFDLQFGELSTALRLKPKYTVADLVTHNGDNEDLGSRLEELLERHDSGVHVLAAPDEPAQADVIDADDVARVIEAARDRFEHVVIDTSAALSEATLVALDHADEIYVLATLDLPSVRTLGLLLSTFQQLKVPSERAKLVLNKVEPDVGIDVDRMTKYFPQGFSMVIPYGRDVNRSLNMGQPVLAYAPRGDVSKALMAGLSGGSTPGSGAEPESPRRRWLGRRDKRSA